MGAWAEDNHRTRVDPLWRPVNETLMSTIEAEQDENKEETSLEEDSRDEDGNDREGDQG